MTKHDLGKLLLDGVWDENISKVKYAIGHGANVNWIINGYPILLHAVFTRNKTMVSFLISKGAKQIDEALGFALDRALGDMVRVLMFEGHAPTFVEREHNYGPYPRRSVVINQA